MTDTRQLLLLEDEVRLRRMIARALSRLPALDIVEVGTLGEACQALTTQAFDVILSDIDLPDGIGISLLDVLRQQGRAIPIIFMTAYLGVYGEQIPRESGLVVLEKPFELDDLRKLISSKLDASQELQTPPFSLLDYIQLSCMGQHSVEIELKHDGVTRGMVQIVSGQLWAALDMETNLSDTSGEETLSRLLFGEQKAHLQVRRLDDPQPQNIHTPWQALLLDLARVHDEKQAERPDALEQKALSETWDDPFTLPTRVPQTLTNKPEPAPEPPPEPAPPPAKSYGSFDEAWEDGVDALLSKEYQKALAAFRAAEGFRPDDPRLQANLERLASMGIE